MAVWSGGEGPSDSLSTYAAFTEEWLKRFQAWIRTQVDRKRLPSDFSADCAQAALLRILEQDPSTAHSRAVTLRDSKDAIKKVILTEYAHQKRNVATDDTERVPQRSRASDWLRCYFSEAEDSPLPDAELDQADARRTQCVGTIMKILERNLRPNQMQLLRLHHMSVVPGTDRHFTLKEIARMLGLTYESTRQLHSKTLKQVRTLLAGPIAGRPLR